MTKHGYAVTPLLMNLDFRNWEHQELARAIKVERHGPLCRHGHAWLTHGVLCSDGRVRCKLCMRAVGTKGARRRRTMKRLATGGGE